MAAAALVAVTVGGFVLAVVVSVHADAVDGAGDDLRLAWLDGMLMILPLGVAGAVLIDRRGDLPFGWLLGLGAGSLVLSLALVAPAEFAVLDGSSSATARWAIAIGSGLWFVPEAVKGIVNVRFPTGQVRGRGWRAVERGIVAGTVLTLIGAAFGSLELSSDDSGETRLPPLDHPLTEGSIVADVADVLVLCAPLTVLLGLVAGVGVLVRWRRAAGLERQQLTWRAVGVVIGIALFPVALVSGPLGYARVEIPFFVLTLVLPVLRYRLWSIDTIVRRSVAYTAVFGLLVACYAAVSATVAALASDQVGAIVAAIAVAVVFSPLRDGARRLVDRWFFGHRHDPYRALSDLGSRLVAVNPRDVPPTVVEAVQRSLRVPYVAIERNGVVVAATGRATSSVERWPLVFEGSTLGYLVAAPRRGEDAFDGRDRTLLADVAKQAGVAVRAAGLTTDLLASRERLVTAREEERRRLRRDLHDDLGPLLTAIGLDLDAARTHGDPDRADALLGDARAATAQAIGELRRVVEGLRPPALDDLGLVGALRAQAARLEGGRGIPITLDAPDLPELPAAVEVAGFRTAIEALHNAVKHSGATSCAVRLALDDGELAVEVLDDGPSPTSWTPGVGLRTMRERADELGGTLEAGPQPGGGGLVRARFPLPEGIP